MAIEVRAEALREALLAQMQAPAAKSISGIVAAARGGVYAAGGCVRDTLLERRIVDIDLVTEDDAVALVRAALPDAKVTVHARFRTAALTAGNTRIDLATSRAETYTHPGALPDVEPAQIEADLRRRDFTMNALALRLDGAPVLLDPCGGVDDIAARRIRVLHDRSFEDDATRIFRAHRYAARLGFEIEAHTADLLRNGVRFVETIGGERLRRELELLIEESTAPVALEACAASGALTAIHSALGWTPEESAALKSPAARHAPRIPFGFALLARHASQEDAGRIVQRLSLKRAEAAAVRGIASMTASAQMLSRPGAKPSGVVVLLDRFPVAAVAALAATETSIAAQTALRYLDEWRHERPLMSGAELQALGVPEGPRIQQGLQLIRAARLDGWATDAGDERALALRFAKSIRDSATMTASLDLHIDDRRN